MHKRLKFLLVTISLFLFSISNVHARPNGVYFLQCSEDGHATLFNIAGTGEPYGGCAGGPWTIKVIWKDGGWVPSSGPGNGAMLTHTAELISALEDLSGQAAIENNQQAVLFYQREIVKQKGIMKKFLKNRR